MAPFTIALLQLAPAHTHEENIIKGLAACKRAKAMGADLALFPEMWHPGYDQHFMTPEYAVDHNSQVIKQVCAQAKKLELAIAFTYLGKSATKPTNNLVLIDAQGAIILDYAKVHICAFNNGTERLLQAGDQFKVAELKFAQGSVQIGAMICFDREFPESARALMLKGAEIIVVPNACPMAMDRILGDVRLQQLRSRAFENMVGIALANYPAPKDDGHSCAFNVDGKPLVIAGQKEGIFLATFDLDYIRDWQRKEVWGAACRRPECY